MQLPLNEENNAINHYILLKQINVSKAIITVVGTVCDDEVADESRS